MTAEIGDQGGDVLLKGMEENAGPLRQALKNPQALPVGFDQGESENCFQYSRQIEKSITCQQGLMKNFEKILSSEVVKFPGLSPLDFQKAGEGERLRTIQRKTKCT